MISVNNTEHWLVEKSIKHPDSRAIITQTTVFTYKNLFNKCFATANYLKDQQINQNDHVGILAGHDYIFFIIVNSLWLIGAVPVPLNTRHLTGEIESQIKQSDIKLLLIDEKFSAKYSEINFKNKLFFSADLLQREDRRNTLDPISQFSIDATSLIMFTSGSSGKPKAVVHTFRSLYESVKAIDSFAGFSNEDVWLASLPFYHIGGFMILMRSLIAGASVALPVSLNHSNIGESFQKFEPTHISIVPTTLSRLLAGNIKPYKKLKYVFVGGGPSENNLILQAVNAGWPVVKVYGSTETCSMISALRTKEIKNKYESSGKILSGNKIQISNSINDHKSGSADIEVTGEILVSSGSLFKEYYNDRNSTLNFLNDGWFRTGDFGWIDKEGYLFVEARREDLIITGGENVSVAEVETAIKSHKLIEDAFVFSLQDEVWGQVVCAAIVSDSCTENELINFLKVELAGYKIPKRFFFMEKIPRNEMGKVIRPVLFKELNLD